MGLLIKLFHGNLINIKMKKKISALSYRMIECWIIN